MVSLVRRLRRRSAATWTSCAGQRIGADEALPLPIEERRSLPPTAARLRGSRNDAARGFLVFRLVVLGDYAELLDRIEGERVTATRILPGHAARREIVLVARAIDEDVDVVCRKCPGRERFTRVVDPLALDAGPGCQLDQIEKVAI